MTKADLQEKIDALKEEAVEHDKNYEILLRLVGLTEREWNHLKSRCEIMSAHEFLLERLRDKNVIAQVVPRFSI